MNKHLAFNESLLSNLEKKNDILQEALDDLGCFNIQRKERINKTKIPLNNCITILGARRKCKDKDYEEFYNNFLFVINNHYNKSVRHST